MTASSLLFFQPNKPDVSHQVIIQNNQMYLLFKKMKHFGDFHNSNKCIIWNYHQYKFSHVYQIAVNQDCSQESRFSIFPKVDDFLS